MMKCTNCGTQNAENFKFCQNCGTPLNVPLSPTQPAVQTPAIPEVQNVTLHQPLARPVPVDIRASNTLRVVVTDFDISFNSMVWLLVKAALAAIPASIILAIPYFFIFLFFGGILGACFRR